jgi:hypothetical protein
MSRGAAHELLNARVMRFSFLLWAIAVVGGVAIAGCTTTKTCTLVGCESGATLAVDVRAPSSATRMRVEICRGATCVATAGDADAGDADAGGTGVVVDPNAPDVDCGLPAGPTPAGYARCDVTPQSPGRIQFVASLNVADTSELHDGDTYRLRVYVAGSATPLVDVSESVHYEAVYPNGRDCDSGCMQASVKRSL